MIKINLVAETPGAKVPKARRPEAAAAPGAGIRKGDLTLLLVMAISVVVAGGWWYKLSTELKNQKRTERTKRAERDELKPFIQKVEELEAKRAALRHKIEVINNLKENQRGPVRIMDEVSKALPELVWLTSMNLSGTNLTLRGQAMDENAVANYIANLDASAYFQEPELTDMSRSGAGDVFSFSLKCVFTHTPKQIEASSEAST